MIAPGVYTTARSSRRWRRPVVVFDDGPIMPGYLARACRNLEAIARCTGKHERVYQRELRRRLALRKRRRGWA